MSTAAHRSTSDAPRIVEGRIVTSASPEERMPEQPAAGRRGLVMLAVFGLMLILAPVVFQMFARAPKGATMISDFKPFMTSSKIATYESELAVIRNGVRETDTAAAGRFERRGLQKRGSGTEVAAYQSLSKQWPAIDATMSDLLKKVDGNLGNYHAVAALPPFGLFPWFFVAPGAILLGLALAALYLPGRRRQLRIAMAVLGIGLILAPAVFQMFTRAPKGGQMMTAFKTIETTQKVQQVQGYFGDIASGQGAVRLEIVPALEKTGLSPRQMAKRYPAMARFVADWNQILNDFTPMIGAMSDNVDNYQAVAALPPFPLFPWFFVIPGVAIAAIALFARPRPFAKE